MTSVKSTLAALLPRFFWKRYKFTILLGSTVVCVLWFLSTIKTFTNMNQSQFDRPVPVRRFFWETNKELVSYVIPETWLERKKCPACFGEDLCHAIEHKEVILTVEGAFIPETTAFAFGTLNGQDVIVKRLGTSHYFNVYDKFICGNRTQIRNSCDVSKMSLQSYVSSQDALMISELQKAYKIVGKSEAFLTNNLCLTPKLLQDMESMYSQLRGSITREERAIMYTSIVINYEAVLGKYFTTKHKNKWKFPNYYGACGRVVIEENGGIPLERYNVAPWDMRAAIGLQLLRMVDDFVDKDPDWLIFFPDIRYPNFSVDKEGYVLAIDLDNIMIIDKKNVENYSPNINVPKFCNADCFRELAIGFKDDISKRPEQCAKVSIFAKDMMHSILCQKIFSDLKDHKGYDLFDGRESRKSREQKGLLHGPPEDGQYFEQLLKECVAESSPNGRKEAITKIKAFLQKQVKKQV